MTTSRIRNVPREELGLCDPPRVTILYVGRDEAGAGDCWYEWDHNSKQRTYVAQRALKGYITGIRVRGVQFEKWGEKSKLEVFIDADRPYMIRSGGNTAFTRGLIQSLGAVEDNLDLQEVVTITVTPGNEPKVVLASVYLANNQKVKYQSDRTSDLQPLLEGLQSVLGSGPSREDEAEHHDEDPGDADLPADHRRRSTPSLSSPRAPGLANADQLKELKRCGAAIGYIIGSADTDNPECDIDRLNHECGSFFNGKAIEQLTVAEAIEFRKILLAA